MLRDAIVLEIGTAELAASRSSIWKGWLVTGLLLAREKSNGSKEIYVEYILEDKSRASQE
jgi:hypothetical protein